MPLQRIRIVYGPANATLATAIKKLLSLANFRVSTTQVRGSNVYFPSPETRPYLIILLVSPSLLRAREAKSAFSFSSNQQFNTFLVFLDDQRQSLNIQLRSVTEDSEDVRYIDSETFQIIYGLIEQAVRDAPTSSQITKPIYENVGKIDVSGNVIDVSDAVLDVNTPEAVSFTQFLPESIPANRDTQFHIYVHMSAALERVELDFRENQTLIGEYQRETAYLQLPFRRGTRFTIIPVIQNARTTPINADVIWEDDLQPVIFSIRPNDQAAIDGYVQGEFRIMVGPLVVASLPLRVRVTKSTVKRESGFRAASGIKYRKLFLSYSRSDDAVVRLIDYIYSRYPEIETYIDYKFMRAGDHIWPRIQEKIHEAEALQLFWSPNSAQSKWVEKEWRFALSLPRAIVPLIFGRPRPEIPVELEHINFADMEDYIEEIDAFNTK